MSAAIARRGWMARRAIRRLGYSPTINGFGSGGWAHRPQSVGVDITQPAPHQPAGWLIAARPGSGKQAHAGRCCARPARWSAQLPAPSPHGLWRFAVQQTNPPYPTNSARPRSHKSRTTSPAVSARAMAADCPAQACIRLTSPALPASSRIACVRPRWTG